jgi:hypothetical protein
MVEGWCRQFVWASSGEAKAADPEVTPQPTKSEAMLGNQNASKTEGKNRSDNITSVSDRGNKAEYLVRRLKRDAPAIASEIGEREFDRMTASETVQGERCDLTSGHAVRKLDAEEKKNGRLRAINRAPAVVQRLYDQDLLAVELAEARTLEEVKDIRDKAQAIQYYLRQQGYCFDAQQDAAELKVRADRKLGELLAQEGPRRGAGLNCHGGSSNPLPDGVTHNQSSRWQRVYKGIKDEAFEEHLKDLRAKRAEITTAGVLRLARDLKREETDPKDPGPGACTVDDLRKLVPSVSPAARAICLGQILGGRQPHRMVASGRRE